MKHDRGGRLGVSTSSQQQQQQQQRKQRKQPRSAGVAPTVPFQKSQRHNKTMVTAAAAEEEEEVKQRQDRKQRGPGLEASDNNLDGGLFGDSTIDLGAGSTIDLGASVASTSDLQEASWERLSVPATTGKRWDGGDESSKTNRGGAHGGEASCDVLQGSRQGQRVGSVVKGARAPKSDAEEGDFDRGAAGGGRGAEDRTLSGFAGAAGDTGSASIGGTESPPRLEQPIDSNGSGGRRVGDNVGSGGGNGSNGGRGGSGHLRGVCRHKSSSEGSPSAKIMAALGSETRIQQQGPNAATLMDTKKVGALAENMLQVIQHLPRCIRWLVLC